MIKNKCEAILYVLIFFSRPALKGSPQEGFRVWENGPRETVLEGLSIGLETWASGLLNCNTIGTDLSYRLSHTAPPPQHKSPSLPAHHLRRTFCVDKEEDSEGKHPVFDSTCISLQKQTLLCMSLIKGCYYFWQKYKSSSMKQEERLNKWRWAVGHP